VLLAPLIAIPGNICRTLILSLSAHYGGLAQLKKVHDTAGWSILVVNLIGLGIAVVALRKMEGFIGRAGGDWAARPGNKEAP
jgi:exosortase/archaeosortase family protein